MLFRARRNTRTLAVLAASIAISLSWGGVASAGDDRTISFYHIHTKETLTIQYKKDGEYVADALKKINWLMRDWRKNEAISIDPKAIDIIWEMHEELGSKQPVHVICGYRSRGTNSMLRKTRGGQASQSQHITGKAIDISFPDVPVRRMRYSAMIRERGGVGYYPTSGIPFVHVDTARVRHWPRMPRDELALLFPSGHSKHEPADGRPITPSDVKAARTRSKSLAVEVAQFYELRNKPKAPTVVADARDALDVVAPAPKPAQRPKKAFQKKMAVGAPIPAEHSMTKPLPPVTAPKLVAEPRIAERPTKFAKAVPEADRSRLDRLVSLAALMQTAEPNVEAQPKPPVKLAALGPMLPAPSPQAVIDTPPSTASTTWISAPEFDDDHPEELSYRPFPLAPFLTDTASFDDPALATLVAPDALRAVDALDDEGSVPPLKLRPGQQNAALMWAQEFRGQAVSLAELDRRPSGSAAQTSSIAPRAVKTTTSR